MQRLTSDASPSEPADEKREQQNSVGTPTVATATPGFEMGWSEEHLCAWRKEVKGPKLRGPLELSQKPTVDKTVDPDSPVICTFHDGEKFEVAHVTMVTRMEQPLASTFALPNFFFPKGYDICCHMKAFRN